MDRERLDLSPLDPRADPQRWERLVRAIATHAAPELARRARTAAGPMTWLARVARPALPMAAALAALSAIGLALASRPSAEVSAPSGVIEALAPPDPLYGWLAESRSPATSDLILAIEEESP